MDGTCVPVVKKETEGRKGKLDGFQRTQVTITCGSNLRFQNNGARQDFMAPPYQIRSCNTSPDLGAAIST
jgi:hypothetical protein